VRIAELMATLSYAADLGLGQPMEHCLRQTVIGLRLADLVGASESDRAATYYLGLVMNVYCHADATEQARWFGDDISFKGDGFGMLDLSGAGMLGFILRRVSSHGSAASRARRLASFPVTGPKLMEEFLTTHSTLGGQFAEQVGLDPAVGQAIRHGYEQWDGKGPGRVAGPDISLPARLVQLAGPMEVFLHIGHGRVRRPAGHHAGGSRSACARSRNRARSRSLRVSAAARSNSCRASSRRSSLASRSPRTAGRRG